MIEPTDEALDAFVRAAGFDGWENTESSARSMARYALSRSTTRALADHLRSGVEITMHHRVSAAAAIDALLDAIEAGGMVQPRQAPQMDLGPLRELRAWHRARHDIIPPGTLGDAKSSHARAVLTLNRYFPQDDQL